MKSFINGESKSENESEQNFAFVNAQIDINESNAQIEQEALERIADCDDYSNLCAESDEDESSLFEFEDAQTHINEFKSSLLPKAEQKDIHNSFIRVILYKIRQMIENKIDICDEETLKQNEKLMQLMEQLSCDNLNFSLDLQEFERVCYKINEILIEHNFFLRVFEQKNKYRNILVKKPEKQTQIKQLASCLMQKYNGFQVIKNSLSKRERRKFEPIDIIYIPTKNAQIFARILLYNQYCKCLYHLVFRRFENS